MKIKLGNIKLVKDKGFEDNDLLIENNKVIRIGKIPDTSADVTYNLQGCILTRGLIDLHTHVYYLSTSLGVNPDELGDKSGTSVFVDAGSSGAGNFTGLREYIIKRSKYKIYAFLNIAFAGIPFFGVTSQGQFDDIPDLEVADVNLCANTINSNRQYIIGVKVRLSKDANGRWGIEPLRRAKECARRAKVKVMVHFGIPPPFLRDILPYLEKGDILTHIFRPEPNSVIPYINEVKELKKKGVIIDVGHGKGSFSFNSAKIALEEGLLPDTISTDAHAFSIPYPVVDLPTTMSKFLNLGMELYDIFKATTITPANVIGNEELGKVIQGINVNELVCFKVIDGNFTFYDAEGKTLEGKKRIVPFMRFTNGKPTNISYL